MMRPYGPTKRKLDQLRNNNKPMTTPRTLQEAYTRLREVFKDEKYPKID